MATPSLTPLWDPEDRSSAGEAAVVGGGGQGVTKRVNVISFITPGRVN